MKWIVATHQEGLRKRQNIAQTGLPRLMMVVGYVALLFSTTSLSKTTSVRNGPREVVTSSPGKLGPGSSLMEEIVPPNLRSIYAPQNLLFNLTRSMLRSSRPVVGNTQRLHLYLRKLRSRKCTTVLFIGGSVTGGHNAGGSTRAYPARWMTWLNERYPCIGSNGRAGKHGSHVLTHAGSSAALFSAWSSVSSIGTFDLVLTEFNVNDSFIKSLPHALEDKGTTGDTPEYCQAWYFEVLLRRLLLLRKPDPVAVVTFNADYVGRIWSFPPYTNPEDSRKELFRRNQEPLKIWVSSMYEVPVVSAVIWMLPLAGKKGREWQFNRTANKYNTAEWHADACCHPPSRGHLLLSLVLSYCLIEEEQFMLSYNEDDMSHGQHDFTTDDIPVLRDPLYLSPEEDAIFVQGSLKHEGFDFTDVQQKAKWEEAIIANEGWSWYADNKENDKYGLIVDNVSGGSHLAISLVGATHGRVELSYVVSYENFGVALAWLDESNGNVHEKGLCEEEASSQMATLGMPQQLTAIWSEKASVPRAELLQDKLKDGEKKILHVCLSKRSENRKGPGNKFKLLAVKSF